jgi:hypothetical protein
VSNDRTSKAACCWNLDGSDRKTIVTNCHFPDGIVVDAKAGHIYWTNMGVPNLDDGSIERVDLDGRNRRVIPQGITHTPKQIHLDKDSGKLYWCDREGMRAMNEAHRTAANIAKLSRCRLRALDASAENARSSETLKHAFEQSLFEPKSALPGNGIFRPETNGPKRRRSSRHGARETKPTRRTPPIRG